jgi:hypothetical protein
LIVTGWPFIITRFSQPNLIFVAFVPLALLTTHRLIISKRWLDVLWLGLATALIGFSRYQLLIMSVPMLVLAALYWLWREAEGHRTQTLLQLVAATGLAMLLLAPLAGPAIRYQVTRDFPEDIRRDGAEWGESDLLGYFLPGAGVPFIGPVVTERFSDLLTHTPIGLVTLGLVLLGLFARRHDKWMWLTMALLLLVLALGRVLIVNGQTSVPLPYAWLEDNLFLVQLIRNPSRFAVLLSIPVAVLGGFGMLRLSRSLSPSATWVVAGVLAVLIVLGYRVPDYSYLDLETPVWYESLAAEEDTFGLATIPLSRTFDEYAMSYQLTHNKPLVGGHVSRPPREATTFIRSTPFLDSLRGREQEPPDNDDISGQLRPLAENNMPYLIIHKRFLTPEQIDRWRDWLGIAPLHEDGEVLVYPTALQAGEDFRSQETSLPGLAFVSGHLSPESIAMDDPLSGIIHWFLDTDTAHETTACYELTDIDNNLVEENCQPLMLPPASGEDQLVRQPFEFALEQTLTGGTYQLAVRVLARDGQVSRRFDLGPLYVTSEGRQFFPPEPKSPLVVALGTELFFIGYDGPQVGINSLDLTLFWQAAQEMDISYRFYVHVFEARSGELVTQLDGVPRNWSYPTNVWDAGEYVSDRLSLPLSDTSSGDSYRVEIGVYHPDTRERLVAKDEEGVPYINNIIPLGEVATEGEK